MRVDTLSRHCPFYKNRRKVATLAHVADVVKVGLRMI